MVKPSILCVSTEAEPLVLGGGSKASSKSPPSSSPSEPKLKKASLCFSPILSSSVIMASCS